MSSSEIVRFWQPASEAGTDFIAASLSVGRPLPHVHSEWQFAVAEMPTGLSIGAFRRFATRADTVTVVPPLTVHTEGAGSEAGPGWRLLYVAPAVIDRLGGHRPGGDAGSVVRFQAPALTNPARAAELRELLRESDEGLVDGAEFKRRALAWLEHVLEEHASRLTDAPRSSAVERARALLHSRPTQSLELPEIATVAGTQHLAPGAVVFSCRGPAAAALSRAGTAGACPPTPRRRPARELGRVRMRLRGSVASEPPLQGMPWAYAGCVPDPISREGFPSRRGGVIRSCVD